MFFLGPKSGYSRISICTISSTFALGFKGERSSTTQGNSGQWYGFTLSCLVCFVEAS